MTVRHYIYPDEEYLNRRRKKDAKGNPICINCGSLLPKRRWLYCSDGCNMEFYRRHVKDWNMLREEIFERDNNICRDCGKKFDMNNLECDHIIPIFLGGKEFDRANLQTLCEKCHKKKTARDKGKLGKLDVEVRMGVQRTIALYGSKTK